MSLSYTISCNLSNLKGLRDFVKQTMQSFDLSGRETDDLVLAVDEMVANQMIHSHHCDPRNTLELLIYFIEKERSVVIEIIDEGKVFNINEFAQPKLEDIIQERRKGGLGIRLVRSIMDKIEYISKDNKNICRMTKKFTS